MSEELKEAITYLKKAVKHSTSLDEFRHLDPSLIGAEERDLFEKMMMVVQRAIRNEEITKEDFSKYIGLK